jgi:hypothetical protein
VVNGSPGFGDVLLLQPHAARQAVDAFLGKAAPAATRPPATTGSGSGHAAPAGQPATPDFDPRPC